jgi:5'(3')-deoxyribonucleotidase
MGFYRSLEPIKHAVECIEKLGEMYDIWFLTRPSYKNPHCYTEKRLWIEDKFGIDMCSKLILCPDKSLIKGEGDYLIDDYPWPGFEGTQLLFGSDEYSTWFRVFVTLRSAHENRK